MAEGRIPFPNGEHAPHVWNPTHYLRVSQDPAATVRNMDAIERWRLQTRAQFHHDPGSQAAIDLEAHVRQLVTSFLLARPLPDDMSLGNAALTALAGTLGAVAAQSVHRGSLSRDRLIAIIVDRIDAIIASGEGLNGDR